MKLIKATEQNTIALSRVIFERNTRPVWTIKATLGGESQESMDELVSSSQE